MDKYLNQLRKEIRLGRYSYQTERAYVGCVKRYLKFLHKMNIQGNYEDKISAYLNFLTEKKNVAASTQNQALCSLVFFYEHILDIEVGTLQNLKYASKKTNLPVVLSENEVRLILSNLSGVKKMIVSLLYGSGLRISECLRLRILDLDFDYQQIEIRNSKGNRDRVSILPESVINPLKHHIKTPTQKRLRHPNRPGTPRTQERENNHDLYPRPQQGRQRRKKSAGQLMISVITNLI
jgi:site-specific recombinase XerD